MEAIVARSAGIDIGTAVLKATVRVRRRRVSGLPVPPRGSSSDSNNSPIYAAAACHPQRVLLRVSLIRVS